MNIIEKIRGIFYKNKVPSLNDGTVKSNSIIYTDFLDAIIHNDNIYKKFISYRDKGENKELFGQDIKPDEYIMALTRYVNLEQKYGARYTKKEKNRIIKLIGKEQIRKTTRKKDYVKIIKRALLDIKTTLKNPKLCELIIIFYNELNNQMLRLPENQEEKIENIRQYLEMNKYILEHHEDSENNQELDPEFQKELLEKLDLIDDIEKKVFYLYDELNRRLEYDNEFLATTSEERVSEIYNRQPKAVNNENIKLVCKTWAELYCSLLNKLNIDAVVYKNGIHCFVLFKLNGQIFKADATKITLAEEYGAYINDLTRAKINMKPNSIGPLHDDRWKAKKTYKKMGYDYKEGEEYFDDLIKRFHELMQDEEKLDISILGIEQGTIQESVINKLNIINGLISNSNLNNIELINYYNCLADNFFETEEDAIVDDITFVKADDLQMSKIISIENVDKEFLYLYIDASRKMIKITPDELARRFDTGEFFINNKEIKADKKVEDSIHSWRLSIPGFCDYEKDHLHIKSIAQGEEK